MHITNEWHIAVFTVLQKTETCKDQKQLCDHPECGRQVPMFWRRPWKQRQCVTPKGWYLPSQLCGVITHKISARSFQHCQISQDLQLFSHSKNLYKKFTKGTNRKKILTVIIN